MLSDEMLTGHTHSIEGRHVWRDLWFAVSVALALAVTGIFTHQGLPEIDTTYLSRYPSDSSIYLSMAAHRDMDTKPGPTLETGWTPYTPRPPFRYRILVPWLARQLPFGPVFSMAMVNYVSLAGAYVFLLLACRRLGLSRWASAFGLATAFTFVSHLPNYANPWMTDGFILLILSGMTYAFVADAFWLFAALGLVGILAREVPAVLLPVWCLRDVKRGATVTVMAVAAIAIERAMLFEDSGPTWAVLHPSWMLNAVKHTILGGPSGASFWPPRRLSRLLIIDIVYCWGWAFATIPFGLLLLGRDAFGRFMPIAVTLLVAAFGMSLVATDTSREFMVLLPVVVVAVAQLTAALAAEKRVFWLALLAALTAAQFSLSEENVVLGPEAWATWAARVPMIKLGVVWAIGAALLVRLELARRFGEHWRALAAMAR